MESQLILSGAKSKSLLPPKCVACTDWILDPFLMAIQEATWHEACAHCSVCRMHLYEQCYERGGQLYCRYDYFRVFASQCARCQLPLLADTVVMRSGQFTYHHDCFTCVYCDRRLESGEKYLQRNGLLICQSDMERELQLVNFTNGGNQGTSQQNSLSGDQYDLFDYEDDEVVYSESDSEQNCKRPRTILTANQRRRFKAAFELNPKPSRKVREGLAAETGLTVRVVQVWFQNQRAKEKKLARRQNQENNNNNNNNNHSLTKPDVSQNGGKFGSLDKKPTTLLLSDASKDEAIRPISVSNQEPLGDPIDKLYSMQHNYFT